VTAKPENEASVIKKNLIDQIYSAVKWRDILIYIANSKETNFIEIGPGKALTGMVKRTLKNVNTFSINSIADIKNLKNELKK
jgi:[acyl-carrier-protein] S-malonyltransferase